MPPDAARIITPRKIALMTTIISNATQHNGAKKTATIPKPKIVQSRNTLLKNVRTAKKFIKPAKTIMKRPAIRKTAAMFLPAARAGSWIRTSCAAIRKSTAFVAILARGMIIRHRPFLPVISKARAVLPAATPSNIKNRQSLRGIFVFLRLRLRPGCRNLPIRFGNEVQSLQKLLFRRLYLYFGQLSFSASIRRGSL